MFPKKGNIVPRAAVHRQDKDGYAHAIAAALTAELGHSRQAVKTVMRWTHVNERTAKNWFSGKRGPRGEHLLALVEHSDEIFEVVLRLAGRDEVIAAKLLADARAALEIMLTRLDDFTRAGVPSSISRGRAR
jgi:hypothetical protein